MEFISRAGHKLEGALEHFNVDPAGLTCLDVGCSTGGFTDCMLQHGAVHVYSLDTGYGLLEWKLRNDPRVTVMERTNILHEVPGLEPFKNDIALAVIDTSWTRLERSVPATARFIRPDAKILALVKPHYQAQPQDLRKGILPDEKAPVIVERVREKLAAAGFDVSEPYESPIRGGKGNREFWLLLTRT